MRFRKLAAVALIGGLVLTACGKEGTPASPGGGGAAAPAAAYPVASGVTLTGSKTFDAIKARDRVVIGSREDQPGLGFKDATTGERSGFDIEIATMVAAGLGYSADKIDWKAVPSAAREDTIARGEIDYMVGTYTINDKRKTLVSFAGPYFVAGQSLLVRKDESAITGKDTLKGKKVCSVTGSTPIQRVKDQQLTEPGNIIEFQTYSQCVDQLISKQVDAVTTDDAILKGFAAQQPDQLKLVGEPFSEEPYGIGLNKDDSAMRGKINDLLDAAIADGTWQKIYDGTLGKSGSPGTPPQLQRY